MSTSQRDGLAISHSRYPGSRRAPSEVRIELRGELDMASAGKLRTAFDGAFERYDGRGLLLSLDLAEVSFIDVAGFGPIEEVHERVHAHGGRLKIVECSAPVLRLFELVGATHLLNCDGLGADCG